VRGNDDATSTSRVLRLGTRGSALALWQARRVQDRLEQAHPGLQCELVVVSTQGDRDKTTPLATLGGQGIFTKELHAALLRDEIDAGVHSLKDLPSTLSDGALLAATLERDDPRDAFISARYGTIEELPTDARVGTSSRRRMAQLLELRPDLTVIELRGNVDTRMRKVLEGSPENYDGAVLAVAGLSRMGWSERIAAYLSVDDFTPAPGQAALGVDCRSDDASTLSLLTAIDDSVTTLTTGVERSFLRAVGAGCRSPVAAYAEQAGDDVMLRAMLASEDLQRVARETLRMRAQDANDAAADVARRLLERVAG
jgi:hydroxymethylbilane synthase